MKSYVILAAAFGALCAAADSPSPNGVLALLDTLDSGYVTNAAPLAVPVPTNNVAALSVPVTNVVQLVVTNSVWSALDEKRMISTRTFRLHHANAEEVAE